jgi:hypothetical protein
MLSHLGAAMGIEHGGKTGCQHLLRVLKEKDKTESLFVTVLIVIKVATG